MTSLNSFNAVATAFSKEMDIVSQRMHDRMRSASSPLVGEIGKHLFDAGGKRLRPLVALAASAMFDRCGESSISVACSVEAIHTATLLHDDVVDDSTSRRGRPTANLIWDNCSAVLVGDYLLAQALYFLVETGSLEVISVLSTAAARISSGEILQMQYSRNPAGERRIYLEIIEGKTSALFAAAAESGGIVAGASEGERRILRDFGLAFGNSFQIMDDLLDYGGLSARMGKNVGDDFCEGKLTLPVIEAMECADDDERDFWYRVIARGDQKEGDLARAQAIMRKHGSLARTLEEAGRWSRAAHAELMKLPACTARDHLEAINRDVVLRES